MIIRESILALLLFFNYIIHAQTWKPLGPIGSEQYNLKTSAWGGGTGQIHAFAFAPRSDSKDKYDWYCVSQWGGLWKSTDEGQQWTDLNPQLEQVAGICSAIDVAVDPRHPSTIYVATGNGNKVNKLDAPCIPSTGIYRSSDGGKTFQHTGLKFDYEDDDHIPRLIANPWSKDDAIQLFAATNKGLYVNQSDVDKKWQKVLNDENIFTVEVSPNFTKNHTIYASGDDIYVSLKDGSKNSFHPMEPPIGDVLPKAKEPRNIEIAVADRNGADVIYALVYQDKQNFFLCYDGSKWEIRKPPLVEGLYIPTPDRLKMAVNPTQPDNVYVGITYVSRTDDGGKTWQLAGKYCQPSTQKDPLNIHGDIHAVTFIPGTNDIMIGTDGGVFRYLAAEKRDVELNNGLNISQVLGMSAPAQAPQRIMIGKQDTGFDIYDGSEWTNFFGGDGFSVHASPIDSTIYLCNLSRKFTTKEKRPNWENVTPCMAKETALFSNVVFDPKVPNRCFMGGTNISYSDDGAKAFTILYKYHTAGDQPVDFDSQIESMAVSHDNTTGESVVYATNYGFYGGNVCKMIKGKITVPKGSGKACDENLCGSCWSKVTLPNEKNEWLDNTVYSVSGIAVSPDDHEELWICYEHWAFDKTDLKVFHSTDGGASWDAMNKGLPDYTLCTVIKYDAKTKYLYLGTSTGVYINKNDGSGWKVFGESLPKSYVKVLEIQQSIGKIRAGLYGRGVWEADLAVN